MRASIAVGLIFMTIPIVHAESREPAASPAASPVGAIRVTAATSTPKAGAKWKYAVHAKPCRDAGATLTAQIVDPLGGKHAVGFGAKQGEITDVAFHGTFEDFIVWPEKAVGHPLKLRITVVSGDSEQKVDYELKVRK